MECPALRRLVAALVLTWPALPPAPAAAHAIILSAAPAPGAVLQSGDVAVVLRFNSRIDRERSRITLVGPDRSSAALPLDRSTGPDSLAAQIARPAPGRYRLRWQVLGIDGHITRGDIPFEVGR